MLANIYSAYIDNFLNAKDAVRIAKEAKPAFMKFLEVCFSSFVSVCIPLGLALGSDSPLCHYVKVIKLIQVRHYVINQLFHGKTLELN